MRRSLAALALVVAVAWAGSATGQASAAEVPSPPATAHRESATSFIGVVTTGMIASDGCHYLQRGSEWIVDACIVQGTENGQVVPGRVEIRALNADDTLGAVLATAQEDGAWTYWYIAGSSARRVLVADPAVVQVETHTSAGETIWLAPAVTTTPVQLSGAPTTPAQQQHLQLQEEIRRANQAAIDRILAPACNYSSNGCG